MASRGTRRGKRSRQRREVRALDAWFGPDRSRVVHAFPDRWSIREPTVVEDVLREGVLMRNCLRAKPSYGGWPAHPYWSLRDPENFPHAIIDPAEDGVMWVWGCCDNSRPKAAYVQRVREFAATLPEPTTALAWGDAEEDEVAYLVGLEVERERLRRLGLIA